MKFKTKEDAIKFWIRGFNCIPTEVVKYGICADEITPIKTGDIIAFDTEKEINIYGEVVKVDYSNKTYEVVVERNNEDDEVDDVFDINNKSDANTSDEPTIVEYYDVPFDEAFFEDEMFDFPQWYTMWTFNDSEDLEWIKNEENQLWMAELGFRLYEADDIGILFGIDDDNIDFLLNYWEPLYDIRGLDWEIVEDK